MRANGESVGGSYIFDNGFVGAAVSQFNSLYHIPGLDGATNNTRIDMQQTKLTVAVTDAQLAQPRSIFGAISQRMNADALPTGSTVDGFESTPLA